jgi:hypothetical protein
MAARVTRKVPLHESIFKLNEKLNMLMAEMKKLRYVVLQGQQAPLEQEQEQEEAEIQPLEEAPVEPRGPGRRSDWHYWGANWAAKNPDIPRDENFSLKMAEAYRAWKEAHPGQTYLDFRGTDVIDGRKRLTQKKGKKVGPAPPRQVTPLAPLRQATPPLAPLRQATPPSRQPTPPLAPAPLPLRQATPPPSRQKTPNAYKQPSPGPLSTPSLLQGRRETPPQEYYEPAEEEEFVEDQELVPQQEKPVRVPIQEESVEESPEEEQPLEEEQQEVSPEEQQPLEEEQQEVSPEEQQPLEEEQQPLEEEEQALSPEEEASIEAAQQQQQEEEQPEASPEWPEEEQEEQSDLEIITVGQQEYFRTSNNGLFTVTRDEEGNPDIGTWAGVLSDDGTQVVETEQPEAP